MDMFGYLLLGTWQGGFAVILMIIGIILFTLPYLVQPVHGFKFRTLFGLMLILAGIIGIICAIIIGEHEISNAKYKELAQLAQHNKQANSLLHAHLDKHEKITVKDYFVLQKHISRQKRREKLKALLSDDG